MAERAPERFLSGGHRFPEGPIVDRDGTLYICELARACVTRITPGGESSTLAVMDGAPCGLAFGPDRDIYVCNDGAQWVPAGSTGCQAGPGGRPSLVQKLRLDGSFTTLVSEIDGVPLHGANDIVFDPEGGFYFTDTVFPDAQGNPRAGHVCYATMDGRARRVHTGLLIPNGIGLTEDAKTLIVGETHTGKLIAFDVRAPGNLGPPRDFAQLNGGGKPDGLCLDAEGNVITTALGVPALQVFGPGGGPQIDAIPLEEAWATNVCFGGPDFSRLFITHSASGRIVSLPWRTPGQVLFPDR